MDKIFQQLTGGIVVGTNKLETSSSSTNGFIEWIFRRDTLHQPREKLGITFKNNDELRLLVLPNNTNDPQQQTSSASTSLANAVKLQSNRYFVASVNGKPVSTATEFWNIICSSLDCRVQLFDASPIDDLLVKLSLATSSTSRQQEQQNDDDDDDDDEIDFSPTVGPSKQPPTNSNNNNNNNGEPNYEALLAKDPARYGFLKLQHPLHFLWRRKRDETIKARDALMMLEQQVEQDHAKKVEQQVADAAALLDFDSDDEEGNEQQQQQQNGAANIKTNEFNNNKINSSRPHHQFGNDTSKSNEANPFFTTSSSSPEQQQQLPQIRLRETEQIEGAVKYSSLKVPPPPTSTPPFVAFTIRAEQARRLYGSQI